jgi:uncharacterized membrane protein
MFCDGNMTLGGWIWMSVLWLGLFGLLAAVLVSVSKLRPNRPASDGDVRAILDALLARGEIDADEYRRRRALLAETR